MRLVVKTKKSPGKSVVQRISDDQFVVSIWESEYGGQANYAVIKALATHFNVPTMNITITSGLSSHYKIVEVDLASRR
jgi:uncharacterized protein YggU (UPF0235/DUF167 family)